MCAKFTPTGWHAGQTRHLQRRSDTLILKSAATTPAPVAAARNTKRKSACKPGSVVDNHSSGMHVAMHLKRPTRERRGPRQCSPIWSCSGWGLPCHGCCQPRGALLPHHFTLTCASTGGIFSVALSVGSRLPGVTWHPALWSPDFPP